jgi:uncharacterized protein YjbJ (UPF0337 family)
MSETKTLTQRIAGKAKQAVGEILGDQDLHEQGKAEAGRDDRHAPNQADRLKQIKRLK